MRDVELQKLGYEYWITPGQLHTHLYLGSGWRAIGMNYYGMLGRRLLLKHPKPRFLWDKDIPSVSA